MVCSLPDTRGQGSSFSPPNSGKFWFSFKQRLSKKHYIWPLYLKTLTHYISVNLVLRMAAFSCDLTQFDCGREASVCLKTMKTFLFFTLSIWSYNAIIKCCYFQSWVSSLLPLHPQAILILKSVFVLPLYVPEMRGMGGWGCFWSDWESLEEIYSSFLNSLLTI